MSIFEAEMRSKINISEEVLTSRVFGTLNLVDRAAFLSPIIKKAGIGWSRAQIENSEMAFWPAQETSEPDVVLTTENKQKAIFIEAKKDSPLDTQHLVEEYKEGRKRYKDFCLLAVTKDPAPPPQISEAEEILRNEMLAEPNLRWIKWQEIYSALKIALGLSAPATTDNKLVAELVTLMEFAGLRGFEGFSGKTEHAVYHPEMFKYLEEVSAFIDTLTAQLAPEGIQYYGMDKGITSSKLDSPATWLPRCLNFWFFHHTWERETTPLHGLFLRFPMADSLRLWVGYSLRFRETRWGAWEIHRYHLSKEVDKKQLCARLRELEHLQIFYGDLESPRGNPIAANTADPAHFESEALQMIDRIQFALPIDGKRLAEATPEQLLEEVKSPLLQLCNLVNEFHLYATLDEKKNFEQQRPELVESTEKSEGTMPEEGATSEED